MNSELKRTYIRMLVGAAVGFFLLFILSLGLMYKNGWLGPAINQFSGPPPLMTTLIFGLIGLIFGSFIGLLKFRSPYIWVFVIILLGGVFPLLPNEWFQYFPGWFEKLICLLGLYLSLFL